jgi:hypothetical protein
VTYPKLPQGIRHWFKNYCLDQLKTPSPQAVDA